MHQSETILNELIKELGEDGFAKAVGTWLGRKEKDGRLPYAKPDKPARAPHYLAFVRQLTCIYCGNNPCEPHHTGPRGMGQKTDDYRTVPLCTEHHRMFHDGNIKFDKNALNDKILWCLIRYLRIVERT